MPKEKGKSLIDQCMPLNLKRYTDERVLPIDKHKM